MASKKSKSSKSAAPAKSAAPSSQRIDAEHSAVVPTIEVTSAETQKYGQVIPMPHGMPEKAASQSVKILNQALADSITLRDMYKKHHWQVVGPTFNELHLLFDKHFEEQVAIVDAIAERIQILGGISLAMAADIAEETRIPRPPRGREPANVQISRLVDAHTMIIKYAREQAEKAQDAGDSGTNDLLVSDVLRANELQVWFLSEHLVKASPV